MNVNEIIVTRRRDEANLRVRRSATEPKLLRGYRVNKGSFFDNTLTGTYKNGGKLYIFRPV